MCVWGGGGRGRSLKQKHSNCTGDKSTFKSVTYDPASAFTSSCPILLRMETGIHWPCLLLPNTTQDGIGIHWPCFLYFTWCIVRFFCSFLKRKTVPKTHHKVNVSGPQLTQKMECALESMGLWTGHAGAENERQPQSLSPSPLEDAPNTSVLIFRTLVSSSLSNPLAVLAGL